MPTVKDVSDYYSSGYHAFIACDCDKTIDTVIESVQNAIQTAPLRVIDARKISSIEQFVRVLRGAMLDLQSMLDESSLEFSNRLHKALSDLQSLFREKSCQGFLIIHHIDKVIAAQGHYEIEAPFREVMQFHDDVAIMWHGTRETIVEIRQYERPFYLSHRVFWL